MIVQLKNLAHSMRLHGIQSAMESRIAQAKSKGLVPEEFLTLLLDDEKRHRQNKLATKLVKRAKFIRDAVLEEWDQTYERGISKSKIKEVSSLAFFNDKNCVILLGKTGEGKTHLAIALGKRLCQCGITTGFFSFNLLFEEVNAQKAAGKYLEFLKRINKTDVIILDDFGLRNYSHEEASTLMDILEGRYQKGSVIMTSQVDPKGWIKLFEDPVIAEAIVDRLTKPSMVIKLTGGSYREKLNIGQKNIAVHEK